MPLCDRETVSTYLAGKSVALVGSGPGVLENEPGHIDSHEVVVRINNFKVSKSAGYRTDVFYSFFGASVRKSHDELRGVKLCMCKCPDAKFMESEWHVRNKKPNGVDFRYIYRARAGWWFCDTYVPALSEFMNTFEMLGGRIPSTGFSALIDVLSYGPSSVYMTGFDFFASGIHNTDEKWRPGDPTDPIGHSPERERNWLARNIGKHPITLDSTLDEIVRRESAVLDR